MSCSSFLQYWEQSLPFRPYYPFEGLPKDKMKLTEEQDNVDNSLKRMFSLWGIYKGIYMSKKYNNQAFCYEV